jgi:hypothetical protein
VFNDDVTGLCTVQPRQPEIITLTRKPEMAAMTSAERGPLITLEAGEPTSPHAYFPMVCCWL